MALTGDHITAIQQIRRAIEKYPTRDAARAGLAANIDMTITGDRATITIEFTVDEKAQNETPEAIEFRVLCSRYGLTPEHLGRKYRTLNRTYILAGMNRRATRFPAIGRDTKTGAHYKTPMPKPEHFLD